MFSYLALTRKFKHAEDKSATHWCKEFSDQFRAKLFGIMHANRFQATIGTAVFICNRFLVTSTADETEIGGSNDANQRAGTSSPITVGQLTIIFVFLTKA
jgi:hypothetical protein